jgi:hypothetical protein
MIEALWYKFLQTWALALVATVLGRYVGRRTVVFPPKWKARGLVYVQVWGITYLAVLAFGLAGHILKVQEDAQIGLAEFLLPLLAGSYYCRQLLIRRMSRTSDTK